MRTEKVGVVIGRFQVDELHQGHISLLEHVQNKHTYLLILLGCRDSPATSKNPLDYPVRERMIHEMFPHAIIAPVYDQPNDREWSKEVDNVIWRIFGASTARLYGGRDSFIPHYGGLYPTEEVEQYSDTYYSGTEIREAISNSAVTQKAFRQGIIYALMNLHPRHFLAVDTAVVYRMGERSEPYVAMIKKDGESLYRFPGGHVELADRALEEAASREHQEETCMEIQPREWMYVSGRAINDWRTADVTDVGYKSALFTIEIFGPPTTQEHDPRILMARAGSDAKILSFLPLARNTMVHVENCHKPLFEDLLNFYFVER